MEEKLLSSVILLCTLWLLPKASGDLEVTFVKCCQLGNKWASEGSACEEFPSPVTGIPEEELAACLTAIDICCLNNYRQQYCYEGISKAKQGSQCLIFNLFGGEFHKDCCEGCKLGMMAASMGMGCQFAGGFSFGYPWDAAYRNCCIDTSTTQPPTEPRDICELYPEELCSHICISLGVSYKCECYAGFQLDSDGKTCVQSDSSNRCSANNPCEQLCVDTGVAVECSCRPGFTLNSDQRTCDDVNECSSNVHRCNRATQSCRNEPGSYTCVNADGTVTKPTGQPARRCPEGFRFNAVKQVCDDVDECLEGTHDCLLTSCHNTIGSFTCSAELNCPPGYRYNDAAASCLDVNECAEGLDNCDRDKQHCLNSFGSYFCHERSSSSCPAGYKWNTDSRICEDINECEEGTHNCNRDRETCRNVIGSFTCEVACSAGYRFHRQNGNCVDINECEEGGHLCNEEVEECVNEEGDYRCVQLPPPTCGPGFEPDSETRQCLDLNECFAETHNCLSTQRCDNTIGSYTCVRITSCGTGYTLNSELERCEDIDECARYPCRSTEKCTNTLGSYTCESLIRCSSGYQLNEEGTGCEDINECEDGSNQCGPKQICINRYGSYTCQCLTGYRLQSRTTCIDIDECSHYRQVCSINSVCENTDGSYRCICNAGFKQTNDGRQCRDVDECEEQPGICHQKCFNTWGTYQCTCNTGFVLGNDERTCEDINECEEYRGRGNLCIGICVNEPGSFRCDCPSGYRLSSDDRVCKDIDECSEEDVCNGPNEVCLNIRGGYKCNTISCPPDYIRDTQHVNKCKRVSLVCNRNDLECQQRPFSYSFNFITFTSNLAITPGAEIVLFTMRAPLSSSARVQFTLTLKDVRAPSGVTPAGRSYFKLRRPATNLAIIALVRSIQGPQEIELELSMKLIYSNSFGGSAVARIFISVSQYEF